MPEIWICQKLDIKGGYYASKRLDAAQPLVQSASLPAKVARADDENAQSNVIACQNSHGTFNAGVSGETLQDSRAI